MGFLLIWGLKMIHIGKLIGGYVYLSNVGVVTRLQIHLIEFSILVLFTPVIE